MPVVPLGPTDDLGVSAPVEVTSSEGPTQGDDGPVSDQREGVGEPSVGGVFHHAEPPAVGILPESLSYRLKKKLLGPPLVTERLSVERLSKPMALGVRSPDCISSTAYGSEEILFVLVRAVGVAAFSLLLPLT